MKATRAYKIVPPDGVYPVQFNAGDDLPEWAVGQAVADGAAASADDPASVNSEPPPGGAPSGRLVAKTKRDCEIELEGQKVKFKKNVKVYDEAARALIAAGHAVEIRADDGAPETKA